MEHPDHQARLKELRCKARKRAMLEDLELHYRRAKRREDWPAAKQFKREIWRVRGF
jgi:hypothetical protein